MMKAARRHKTEGAKLGLMEIDTEGRKWLVNESN